MGNVKKLETKTERDVWQQTIDKAPPPPPPPSHIPPTFNSDNNNNNNNNDIQNIKQNDFIVPEIVDTNIPRIVSVKSPPIPPKKK